jgi:uncharacterized protein YeaO (DUF488 family)
MRSELELPRPFPPSRAEHGKCQSGQVKISRAELSSSAEKPSNVVQRIALEKETAMVARVVRLGSARTEDEGLRIGTVRRPPRGVPKAEFAAQNWYDVWFPNLAPTAQTMKQGQAASTEKEWQLFSKTYRAEMSASENSRTLDLLAALSHQTQFSVGCYCENESRCHRSLLRLLLAERGAKIA